MSSAFNLESTLTDRYQTTVPEAVRLALKLGKRDKIRYAVQPNGQVVITRAESQDPALGAFLQLLADDITKHPEHLQSLDASFAARIRAAVSGVEIDLEAELAAEDE